MRLRATSKLVLLAAITVALAGCGGGGGGSGSPPDEGTRPAASPASSPLAWDSPSATWDNVTWQ
jgi:hypothetical protein